MEKNLLLAFFQTCSLIFVKEVAEKLGFKFKSKVAKEFIANCGEHHLTWQILTTVLEAFARELIYIFCFDAFEKDLAFTPEAFVHSKNNTVVNPNFHFYYDLKFKYMLGIKCFRPGIRQKVAPIMFLGKHDIYGLVIFCDMKIRTLAPKDVQKYIEQNEAFSRSGDHCRGEGGDYVMETENKHLKLHLAPGVPKHHQWVVASRNHSLLTLNRDFVFHMVSMKDPSSTYTSVFKFEEIQLVRKLIRKSGILNKPCTKKHLKALDGSLLHHNLVNFSFIATENYQNYLKDNKAELLPVFVTYNEEKEYNDVNNWTKSTIIKRIEEMLSQCPDINKVKEYLNILD